MIRLTAAGGVLFRVRPQGTELLLIKRNGIWDLPKGKLDNGESVSHCAIREVAEETGIPLPMVVCFLCETYHEYELGGEKIGKTTHWYAMISHPAPVKFIPQREEGITEIRWVRADQAFEKSGYENLKKVIRVFDEKLVK